MLRHPSHALSNIVDMHTLAQAAISMHGHTFPRTDVHTGWGVGGDKHAYALVKVNRIHSLINTHTYGCKVKCSMHDLFALICIKIECTINKQMPGTESIYVQI